MKHIIISGGFLLVLYCLSTYVFDPTYLYYEIWWLDIPMHIMGGFGVTAFVNAIFSYKQVHLSYTKLALIYLAIAIAWELYEYILSITEHLVWDRWGDSLADIFNGWIGTTAAYYFIKKV